MLIRLLPQLLALTLTGFILGGLTPAALAQSAHIFVLDSSAGKDGRGLVFRIDLASNTRTVVNDFGKEEESIPPGILGVRLTGIAVDASGNILVVDTGDECRPPGQGGLCTTHDRGRLFRVNPTSGQRTVLSDFNDRAKGEGWTPRGVAVDASDILVADLFGGTEGCGALLRVDPDGSRTVNHARYPESG